MDFFHDHPVLFALVCAAIAVAYGIGLTVWLLGRPAGTERMQEIARAIQEGAAAYLKRQYRTIALVAIVPFLVIGLYNKLGWGTAVGFLVGAALSAAAGFIGMNVAVRSNARTAEAAKSGLKPALNVAFRAGSVTGLLVVGLGLLGVAGYYWALTDWLNHSRESAIDDLVGLAFGGSLTSVFGTWFARVGKSGSIMNALYKAVLVATLLSAAGFIPITMAFDGSKFGFSDLYISSIIGLVVTFLL